ncbi:MAG: histidine kinase [Bacteroidetes bacterium]|nr:histidine kinase [Bacteroidota bacterium]MBU1483456.1 histidine kinase [Bacteroidota bacterium]MBU2269198.1 histidine kinase [Bacteroidota bacterium]
MNTLTIVAICMIGHLYSLVKRKEIDPKWKGILFALTIIIIGIIFLDVTFNAETYTKWFAIGIIGYLIYLVSKNEEFKVSRTIIYSVIPLIFIEFISELVKLINNGLYKEYDSYFSNASSFAIIWIFAMLFMHNRQKKARKKDELQRQIEEEHKRALELKKMQLENQVEERTAELTKQKEELEEALAELKTTQTQLIHHEKMASLGELTAGIAHEIQNPLNFVNNFSEVSMELLDEMEEELQNNNTEDVIAIAKDIRQNLGKITQHGKRADAIVKGMLQHSRTSSGNKVETDINAIADEYLRLSYHGLRAKDKSFNATMDTNYDEHLGMINVVSQDIGRVLLNLFNNSFYSVEEKKKSAPESYKPTVSVTTKKLEDGVEIKVRDNGLGIPKKVLDKIYQPFFTTKPTGEGTGLGLSMSYDIITKGHGGSLKLDTQEGEYAEFVIFIPF